MSAFSSVVAKSLGAALMLSAAMATPVFAQAAISEPGAYSFYHPDGDVLNAGSGGARSVANALAMAPLGVERMHHHAHRVARR